MVNTDSAQPVECKVFVARQELTGLYDSIEQVTVDMRRGQADTCTIVIDSIRTERGEWTVQDEHSFIRPWAELSVEAHFGHGIESILVGLVREVRLEFPADMSGAKVTITGQDLSLALDREHLRQQFVRENDPQPDGLLASQLAREHGLQASTDEGLTNATQNADDTPIRFLEKRAEANGFELFVRDRTLHFKAIDLSGEPQSTILVYAGRKTNCLSFQITHDGHSPDTVRATVAPATGTDPKLIEATPKLQLLGEEATTSEAEGLPDLVWSIQSPNGPIEEVEARVQASVNEQSFKIAAEGELDGTIYGHVLKNYGTVEVDGVGSKYSGRYYVADVVHAFTSEGYRQSFKLLRNATGRAGSDEQRASGRPTSDPLGDIRAR